MNKKLPGVYANKIEKRINNNEKVYYSNQRSKEVEAENITEMKTEFKNLDLNVNQKISKIFNSNKYVYKADVIITTKSGKLTKRIIGQNKTHLITIENELIPISEILNIDFSI